MGKAGELLVTARNHGPVVLTRLDAAEREVERLRTGIREWLDCDMLNAGHAEICGEDCMLCKLLEANYTGGN
jgi:hypothetical protein